MVNLRPVFVPPSPPDICRGCGSSDASLSVYRVCASCETRCASCGGPTGMLRADRCPECRPRSRAR